MAKSAAPFLPIASPAPALPFKAAPTQSRPQLPPSLQQEPPYKAVPTAKSFEQPGQFTRDSSPDASPQNRSASHSNPTLLQSGQTLSGVNAVFSNLQDYPRCDDASMVGITSISCTRIGACSSIPSALWGSESRLPRACEAIGRKLRYKLSTMPKLELEWTQSLTSSCVASK